MYLRTDASREAAIAFSRRGDARAREREGGDGVRGGAGTMQGFSKALGRLKEGDYGGVLKQVQQQVKKVALDMTDLEVAVEEATNLEPWGPHGQLLARIARESSQSEEKFRQVMGVLVERISLAWRKPKAWRHCYKALLVLDFMIKNGSMRVVNELTDDER